MFEGLLRVDTIITDRGVPRPLRHLVEDEVLGQEVVQALRVEPARARRVDGVQGGGEALPQTPSPRVASKTIQDAGHARRPLLIDKILKTDAAERRVPAGARLF